MTNRLALHFTETGLTVELDPRQRITLGVSETCELDLRRYLPEPGIRTISRRHCEIAFVAEGCVIVDLGSMNGTRVNGQPLRPGEPRFLRCGDTIRFAENPAFTLDVVGDDACHTELLLPAPVAPETDTAIPLGSGQLYLADDGRFVLNGNRIPRQHLTALEEKLLLYLYERAGRVCSYDEVARDVWGSAKYDELQDASIAKVISNLRKKLDDICPGAGMRHVRTVRGRGITCAPV